VKVIKVTLDTSVLPRTRMAAIIESARGLPIEFATVYVTHREARGTPFELPAKLVLDTMVLGESELGAAVLGSDEHGSILDSLLSVISDRSFPKRGSRNKLSRGREHQLRDALILLAHRRENRDIFVTEDKKGFINGSRREALERLCCTRIMTVEEFGDFGDSLRISST